jgi:hypothetical protein
MKLSEIQYIAGSQKSALDKQEKELIRQLLPELPGYLKPCACG